MKILQIIFSLSSGGAEKFVVDLSNELSKKHEVHLCVIQSDQNRNLSFFKAQVDEHVNYHNLQCTKGINVKSFFLIAKIIKNLKADIVHIHLNTILYCYIPAILFKKKIKFVHTLHSLPSKTIGFKWQKQINRYFYKHQLISAIVISVKNKELYQDFYDLTKVSLIENGVAMPIKTGFFMQTKEKINQIKAGNADKIFLHIGSFTEAKNQNLLINVFNRILEEKKGTQLLVIGKNFESKKGQELKNRSKKGIHYLGTKTNVSDYLLCSDAFILSSLWEGLPMSLLEALACGVVPICTPAGGIPDVIKSENLGYMSKDFTEQGFYEAIIKCMNNFNSFDSKNLITYYKENFSMEKCAKDYELIYSK